MPDILPLGRLVGLELSARPSALFGTLLLIALFTLLGWFLAFGLGPALLFGLLCTLLHWLSDLVHQLGHASLARRTGYPMTGVRLWIIFGQSLYPSDEPPLPGRIHVRRALGGPIASISLGFLAATLAMFVLPSGSFAWWVLIMLALDSLLILGFGAFLPLGFTDGSTLLTWWGK